MQSGGGRHRGRCRSAAKLSRRKAGLGGFRDLPGGSPCGLKALRETTSVTVRPPLSTRDVTSGGALSANDVQQGDSRDHHDGHRNVLLLGIVVSPSAHEGGGIKPIAGDPAPQPGVLVRRKRKHAAGNLARAIGANESFHPFHAKRPCDALRCDQFGSAQRKTEPAKSFGQTIRGTKGAWPRQQDFVITFLSSDVRNVTHDLSSCAQGLSTTFTQLSCLSRNALYISGPSSRLTECVMTNEGSICPSSMRRNRSSVQRLTCV